MLPGGIAPYGVSKTEKTGGGREKEEQFCKQERRKPFGQEGQRTSPASFLGQAGWKLDCEAQL